MSLYPREPHGLSPRIAIIVATGFVYTDPKRQALYLLRRASGVPEQELTKADHALMDKWRQQIGFFLAAAD